MSKQAAARILEGLDEVLSYVSGSPVPGVIVHVPDHVDVVDIRKKAQLTQEDFAQTIGVSVATLRNWEQGRRHPEGPARVLLALLEKNPKIVETTLGAIKQHA